LPEALYILDPKDVYGPDFSGETFRILKKKEENEYGEYRTHRLQLCTGGFRFYIAGLVKKEPSGLKG